MLPKVVQDYLGFRPKFDKEDNIIGYVMDSEKRFVMENVLGLSGMLRTAGIMKGDAQ